MDSLGLNSWIDRQRGDRDALDGAGSADSGRPVARDGPALGAAVIAAFPMPAMRITSLVMPDRILEPVSWPAPMAHFGVRASSRWKTCAPRACTV